MQKTIKMWDDFYSREPVTLKDVLIVVFLPVIIALMTVVSVVLLATWPLLIVLAVIAWIGEKSKCKK